MIGPLSLLELQRRCRPSLLGIALKGRESLGLWFRFKAWDISPGNYKRGSKSTKLATTTAGTQFFHGALPILPDPEAGVKGLGFEAYGVQASGFGCIGVGRGPPNLEGLGLRVAFRIRQPPSME